MGLHRLWRVGPYLDPNCWGRKFSALPAAVMEGAIRVRSTGAKRSPAQHDKPPESKNDQRNFTACLPLILPRKGFFYALFSDNRPAAFLY